MNSINHSSVRVIHLNGSHYQMGYQHGRQVRPLRAYIIQAMEVRYAQLEHDRADAAFEQLVQATRQVVEAIDPATIALVRGLADGLQLDFERLLRYNLVAFLRDALTTRRQACPPVGRGDDRLLLPFSGGVGGSEGCTTWAAAGSATSQGQPILAKNRDYHLAHLPLQVVVRAEPAQGYRYTYVTSAGSPGVFVAGFNEAGLAVADTHVSSSDVGPGLPTYALSMHLLEEHRTVRSALDYLQAVPRLGRNNLLMADAGGDLALFEIGHHSSATLPAEAGLLVNTNHFHSPAMQKHFVEMEPPVRQGNSLQRYQKVKTMLAETYGQIDLAMGQRLMATHADSLASLCHHPWPGSETSTLSAMLFLPAQRQMLFCHGQPCQGVYQAFGYAKKL